MAKIPNWVHTVMNVNGSKAKLQKFKEFAESDNECLDMDNFIPYPKEFKDQDKKAREHETKMQELKQKAKTDEITKKELERIETLAKLNDENAYHVTDGYNSGGYDWCIANWGTKWNFCNVSLLEENDNNNNLSYIFQTAWSFPTSIALKMSMMFPTLEFEWNSEEESRMFNVIITYKNGKIINEIDVPFEDDDEEEEEE